MDALIFLSIFGTLLAMRSSSSWLSLSLFGISLVATLGLFSWHISSSLNLSF